MNIQNLTGIFCPHPLVYAQPTDHVVTWVYEPLNCAISCPSVTYTEDEWVEMKSLSLYIFSATLLGANLVFAHQCYNYWSKPMVFCRLMFIFGFCATSVLMVSFLVANGVQENSITCAGDFAAIEHSPFCEFQACLMVFLVIWTQMWSFFMALECYLYISSAVSDNQTAGKFNKMYFVSTVAVSSACAFVPLAVGNLGYDIEATAPFCFYMVSETTDYLFATLIYPFMVFAVGCIVLTCATICKIQKTFVLSDKYTYDVSAPGAHETELTSSMVTSTVEDSSQVRMTTGTLTSEVSESPFYKDDGASSVASRAPQPMHSTDLEAVPVNLTPSASSTKGLWSNLSRLARKTWQYSGRQLIFVVTFVMATAFIVPSMIHAFGSKRQSFVDGTEDFASCLFYASVEYSVAVQFQGTQSGADLYAEQKCGTHPSTRLSIKLATGIITWYAAYGLFPVFVFGIASDRFQHLLRRVWNILCVIESPAIFSLFRSDSSTAGATTAPQTGSSSKGS